MYSVSNIWNWSFTNTSDSINLTGTSHLSSENMLWIVNWYLDEINDFIHISMSHDDSSREVQHQFTHQEINISSNNDEDIIRIGNDSYSISLIDDITTSNGDYIRILDRETSEEIKYYAGYVTDRQMRYVNGTVGLYSNLTEMVVEWVDPLFATGNVDSVITVGASDDFHTVTEYSSLGPGLQSQSGKPE